MYLFLNYKIKNIRTPTLEPWIVSCKILHKNIDLLQKKLKFLGKKSLQKALSRENLNPCYDKAMDERCQLEKEYTKKVDKCLPDDEDAELSVEEAKCRFMVVSEMMPKPKLLIKNMKACLVKLKDDSYYGWGLILKQVFSRNCSKFSFIHENTFRNLSSINNDKQHKT